MAIKDEPDDTLESDNALTLVSLKNKRGSPLEPLESSQAEKFYSPLQDTGKDAVGGDTSTSGGTYKWRFVESLSLVIKQSCWYVLCAL